MTFVAADEACPETGWGVCSCRCRSMTWWEVEGGKWKVESRKCSEEKCTVKVGENLMPTRLRRKNRVLLVFFMCVCGKKKLDPLVQFWCFWTIGSKKTHLGYPIDYSIIIFGHF